VIFPLKVNCDPYLAEILNLLIKPQPKNARQLLLAQTAIA